MGISTGTFNVCIGASSGLGPTGGTGGASLLLGNICIGYQAGPQANAVSDTVVIGYQAQTSASNTVAIGNNANGFAEYSIAIGYFVGSNDAGSIVIGRWDNNATIIGINNIFMGYMVGYNSGASSNGSYNVHVVSGTNGTKSIGSYGTIIGYNAGTGATGNGNTLLGASAGTGVTTGTDNTFIGYNAGTGATVSNYGTAIGSGATVTASGAVAIGVDHTGTSAASATQDLIVLGTINHTTQIPGLPAFVAGDKYLVADATGHIHQSALGPVS
jgi:hypothetical protein